MLKNYLAGTTLAFMAFSALQAQNPNALRCEYLKTPLGIDHAAPRLSWKFDTPAYNLSQSAYRIIVGTDSLEVAAGKGDAWDTGVVSGDSMRVSYKGNSLQPFTRYYWKVSAYDPQNKPATSDVSWFETGMMDVANWKGAWISDGYDTEGNSMDEKRAPYFRYDLRISKPVSSARAYIGVAGLYELSVNGSRIGDHCLDPMFTRFDRRNLYVTYDISPDLKEGDNTLGVVLGNGWYNHQAPSVWFFNRAPWRNRPAFCMDIRIVYEDGTSEVVGTDLNWKTSLGPLMHNNIYTGEQYDARLEFPGWDQPLFADSLWHRVRLRSAPAPQIRSQQLHPIRRVEKVAVKSIKKIDDRTWLVDFGRNIAGITELQLAGEPGTTVQLIHGELLTPDGRVDQSNIIEHYRPVADSDPFHVDIYTLSGKGKETFSPRFNYKGFQYVEIRTDRPVSLDESNLCAWFMHSDLPVAGTVHTSNELVNKIWEATNNSYLSNLFGYPTDCPQREKNGWTGDAHIAIETALYNFDGVTVYEKWLADHRDEQQPNGVLPAIIPTSGWGYHWANGVDWTSTIAFIPWNVYLFYGDDRLLRDSYTAIRRYVDYITDHSPEGLTAWGLGDWIPIKTQSSLELTSTAYYYTDACILRDAARLFGYTSDYEKYDALCKKIFEAFNNRFLNVEGPVYGSGTQTEMSMALHWGLVPDSLRQPVADELARRVVANNTRPDVGLLGSKALLNALSDNGYAELAYALAAREEYPSWGWWIRNGATTLYENWPVDSQKLSLNHIMFGEIGAWFYKALGGLKPDPVNPGFKHILLNPHFVQGLTHATITHETPYGEVVSAWRRAGNQIQYKVVVPPNTRATLRLPAAYRLSGMKIENADTAVKSSVELSLNPSTDGSYGLKPGVYHLSMTL